MKKKILSLILVACMSISMLAGCGDSTSSETKSSGSESSGVDSVGEESKPIAVQTDDLSESREITVWLYNDDYKYFDNMSKCPVTTYLNERFNVTLQFQQPAIGSESEQFSIMLGTGSYTDIMEITYSQEKLASLYTDGVVIDIAPYLETYAPNFYAWLNDEANSKKKSALYDEEGHLFTIPMQAGALDEEEVGEGPYWGGMVYRKDIIDTMTGGSPSYPSGNEAPATVEDWEYMLELYMQYFQAAGMVDYAGLILSANGYFVPGEILVGFGAAASWYADDDGTVKYGPTEPEFYNYLVKMNEWYQKGYIYQDFASRTNDVFYFPNSALTYGGAAGMWWGLESQLGDAMSMPEYGLEMNVEALAAPLDTANGVTKALGFRPLDDGYISMESSGYVVSSACSEEDMIRWLTVCDYLFTEEGAMLLSYGLTVEQGADENPYYQDLGIVGGAYTYDGTTFAYNELLEPNVGKLALDGVGAGIIRLPGASISKFVMERVLERSFVASDVWRTYGNDNSYPSAISFNLEDTNITTTNYTKYGDYLNMMAPKFIMGTEELNEDTWDAFVKQMNAYGVTESQQIYQSYYDVFMSK